jgi:hypothetical protein
VEQLRDVLAEYGNIPGLFDDVWLKAGDGVGFTIPSREPNTRIDVLRLGHGAPLQPVRGLRVPG